MIQQGNGVNGRDYNGGCGGFGDGDDDDGHAGCPSQSQSLFSFALAISSLRHLNGFLVSSNNESLTSSASTTSLSFFCHPKNEWKL